MAWTIEFDPRTEKDLRRIGRQEARRIRDYLQNRVAVLDDPRQLGKPLKGQFTELWRYRVGDYRLICELRNAALVVLVIRIGHRREVYR
ncbi:MAG: type II toxin-antitoxin system RelE/ParE family toxin [Pseudomonadota bacterium]